MGKAMAMSCVVMKSVSGSYAKAGGAVAVCSDDHEAVIRTVLVTRSKVSVAGTSVAVAIKSVAVGVADLLGMRTAVAVPLLNREGVAANTLQVSFRSGVCVADRVEGVGRPAKLCVGVVENEESGGRDQVRDAVPEAVGGNVRCRMAEHVPVAEVGIDTEALAVGEGVAGNVGLGVPVPVPLRDTEGEGEPRRVRDSEREVEGVAGAAVETEWEALVPALRVRDSTGLALMDGINEPDKV